MLMDRQGSVFYEYEIEEQSEELQADCKVPISGEVDKTVAFFSGLVDAQASPLSKFSVLNRVKRRFNDVLNFIKRSPEQCQAEGVYANCSDIALVYGNRRARVPDIIEAPSRIV